MDLYKILGMHFSAFETGIMGNILLIFVPVTALDFLPFVSDLICSDLRIIRGRPFMISLLEGEGCAKSDIVH